jgi:hypothetical protein
MMRPNHPAPTKPVLTTSSTREPGARGVIACEKGTLKEKSAYRIREKSAYRKKKKLLTARGNFCLP